MKNQPNEDDIILVNDKTGEEFIFDGSAEYLAKFAMSSDSDFVTGKIYARVRKESADE